MTHEICKKVLDHITGYRDIIDTVFELGMKTCATCRNLVFSTKILRFKDDTDGVQPASCTKDVWKITQTKTYNNYIHDYSECLVFGRDCDEYVSLPWVLHDKLDKI